MYPPVVSEPRFVVLLFQSFQSSQSIRHYACLFLSTFCVQRRILPPIVFALPCFRFHCPFLCRCLRLLLSYPSPPPHSSVFLLPSSYFTSSSFRRLTKDKFKRRQFSPHPSFELLMASAPAHARPALQINFLSNLRLQVR